MWWEELSLFYKIKFIVLAFGVCCVILYVLSFLISAISQILANKKPVNNKTYKIDENEIQKRYQLAKEYSENKEWKKAIWECTVLIKTYPENLDLLYTRADFYNNDGQYDNAVNDYKTILKINPAETVKLKLLAENHMTNKQYNNAIRLLTVLLELEPQDIELLYLRADNYIKASDFTNAVYDYLKIIAVNNKEADAYMQVVSIYNSTSNYQATKDILKQAIKVLPDNEKIRNAYKHILSILSDTDLEKQAQKHVEQEEWEQAISDFSKLIKLYPEEVEYLYARASIYSAIGNLASAIHDYMKITEIDANEVNAYLFMADIYNFVQQYEGTKQVLELALAVRPNDEKIKQAYNEVLNILSEENTLEEEPQANQEQTYKCKINLINCTKEEIQSLDSFNNDEITQKFIELRNSGKIWYDMDSFAMDFELQPHQIIEIQDRLIFPPKPKNKIGRKLDI